ncbi:PLP-dependent aminotransferase family protein [Bifidobacterium callimiconis]|uniref:GntR family transcriptional regulator n=1 Tax=Bifidobacterium callimiconis TaxID=2306973 RepID=A0A430F6X2_9BIFI|nr:PLP-dependent aminotransferase family protein [Bifidobacterium callimiconis]MBT1177779.1 PLP-dependent aminotransferase family protein [Bifidobacterium callimiconis]RSX48031.1 GntR family transcriptional regulator [Bifidobacterium callimiconis]
MARPAPLVIDWKPDRTLAVPVTEQIVQYMCRQVSSGAWPIGSRLPSQRALAEGFGVNRSTVIAAVNELADYGIVEGAHGAGTRIVSNTWSLMLPGAPDWADYVSSGFFKANNDTIQAINRLEFEPRMARLGTGELDPRLFPTDMWRTVMRQAADEIDSMGYPEPEGIPELREAIARHMRGLGIETDASQILVTSGALQALQIISVSLLGAGSTVFAEAPSYIKSLQVFQSAGMHLTGVPMDGDGLNVERLAEALGVSGNGSGNGSAAGARRRGSGSVLYTIPTNHNPTGRTMGEARRRELIECCVANRLPIIEDGAYQDLYFGDRPPLPLKAMDETGMVIYLGSASKALAPGLRIGWIVAPEPIVHRMADVKMQMDYGASLLSQWVFARFLTSGMYDEYLAGLKTELRRRRDSALDTLSRLFGGNGGNGSAGSDDGNGTRADDACRAHWTVPDGGFYIWLTFDRPMPMNRLFTKAVEAGVLLNPGDIYDFEGDNSLRLSYAYTTPEEFETAARKLANVAREL